MADGAVIRETYRTEVDSLSSPWDHEIVCVQCGSVVRRERTGLPFQPEAGTILKCDFTRGFVQPEMTKIRPVVVVSDRYRNRDAILVVGCSGNAPRDERTISVSLPMAKYAFLLQDNWAKCEMVYAVSRIRLSSLDDKHTGRFLDSRDTMIDVADLRAIRDGVKLAIGLP